jgi:hypothetical protein
MSTMTVHTVSDLMKQIDEIAKNNKEVINRIKAKLSESVVSYSYTVTYTNNATDNRSQFNVNQQSHSTPVNTICSQWRNVDNTLSVIPDIFNDKISFVCSTFNDIIRLNDVMLPIVHKYELFGETEKAFEEVGKFCENFKQLYKALEQLEEKLNKKEESSLPQITERFDNVNNELGDIKAKFSEKIRFEIAGPPRHMVCQHCKRQSLV